MQTLGQFLWGGNLTDPVEILDNLTFTDEGELAPVYLTPAKAIEALRPALERLERDLGERA